MKMLLIFFILLILSPGCTPNPRPIEYGADSCDYCKMTVMDPQHAAELVTTKGKVYMFDAIECMVNYLKNKELSDFAHLLIHDYFDPSEWVDANTCTFIISEAIPSPMSAYLSAVSTPERAKELQMAKGGQLLEWYELIVKIRKDE